MTPNENRRPGSDPGNGGTDYVIKTNNNVVPLRPNDKVVRLFDQLTARLVMAQHRAGTLNPAILEALLVGAGLDPS